MTTRDSGLLLMDGETVAWSGRPAQGLLLASRDWLLIPFSLIWCGFVIFWEKTVLSPPQAPLFFELFGAAFVLIGLYFVAGRFLLDAWVRSGTQYNLTNKRVLIARSWPFAKFAALSLNRLSVTSLMEGKRQGHDPLWSAHPLLWARLWLFQLDSVARSHPGVPRHRKRAKRV